MSAQVPDLMKIGSVDTEMTQDVQGSGIAIAV